MLATFNCPHLIKSKVRVFQSILFYEEESSLHTIRNFSRHFTERKMISETQDTWYLLRLECTRDLCSGVAESSNLGELTTQRKSNMDRGVITNPRNTTPQNSNYQASVITWPCSITRLAQQTAVMPKTSDPKALCDIPLPTEQWSGPKAF